MIPVKRLLAPAQTLQRRILSFASQSRQLDSWNRPGKVPHSLCSFTTCIGDLTKNDLNLAFSEDIPKENDINPTDISEDNSDSGLHTPVIRPPLLVVIDLDETLFFSHLNKDGPADFTVTIDKQEIFVSLRPGCKRFLEWCCHKFETGVFTAGTEAYAKRLLEVLDPTKTLVAESNQRYRNSCWPVSYEIRVNDKSVIQTLYVKDLSLFRRDLSRAVLIDNSLFSFMLQPDNGIPITDWRGKPGSEEAISSRADIASAGPPSSATVISPSGGKEEVIICENISPVVKDVNKEDPSAVLDEPFEDERQEFGEFYDIKKMLEALENVDDVKPILRNKYRLIDLMVRRCISGMMLGKRM